MRDELREEFAEFRGSVSATLEEVKKSLDRLNSSVDELRQDLSELALRVGRLNGAAKVWSAVWGGLVAAIISGVFVLISTFAR